MDGLSILLGVLTLVFLIVIVAMNIVNISSKHEGFESSPTQEPSPSEIEKKIRAVLDPMAFYTSPDASDASDASDGEELCKVFAQLRKSMIKNVTDDPANKNLDTTEINKRVESDLALEIPGGALQCPLLQYPKPGSADLDWLSFLQDVPLDFGARVILMAQYADTKLTKLAADFKNAISGNITLPDLSAVEAFVSVCSQALANKKRTNAEEASCSLPEDLSPQQIDEAVTTILQQIVRQKQKILLEISGKRSEALLNPGLYTNPSIHQNIVNAKVAAKYLSEQLDSAQAGTLMPTQPNPQLSG